MPSRWNEFARRQQAAAEVETAAARRQEEIARQIAQLKEMQEDAADRDSAAQDALRYVIAKLRAQLAKASEETEDIQYLHQQVASLNTQLQEKDTEADRIAAQMAEVATLREQLEQREVQVAELQTYCDRAAQQRQNQAANLQAARAQAEEIARLRGQIEEQQAPIAELEESREQAVQLRGQLERQEARAAQVQAEARRRPRRARLDVQSYETELNGFRRQLETDRRALDQELERLQQRKIALDDMGRETEMELSRERAALGRAAPSSIGCAKKSGLKRRSYSGKATCANAWARSIGSPTVSAPMLPRPPRPGPRIRGTVCAAAVRLEYREPPGLSRRYGYRLG